MRYGLSSLFVTFACIVALTVTLHYKLPPSDNDDDFTGFRYAPVDTRIVSSSPFCEALTLRIGESEYSYQVSLYTLRSPPNRTRHEIFSFTKSMNLGVDDYEYFYYHMFKGSNFTVSGCAQYAYTSATFYLIKGNITFEKWLRKGYDAKYTEERFDISNQCSTGVNTTYNYTINATDNYFMVLYTSYHPQYLQEFNVYLYINRILYAFDNTSIVDSCSSTAEEYYSTPCSVSTSLTGTTSLLTVELPENHDDISMDLTDSIIARTYCRPRAWLYAVVSITGFLTCVLLCVLLMLTLCLCAKKNRNKNAENYRILSAGSDDTTVFPPNSKEAVPPPPIVNPNYYSTNNYGSTFESPPQYTYKE